MKAKTFRKTFPMLPAIALMAATLALMAALPARATTFIKDLCSSAAHPARPPR